MAAKVGVRDFRTDLASYIDSEETVAITRHGRTVGFFVPTRANLAEEVAAFETATKRLRQAMAAQGIDEEDIVAEFDALRKAKKR